MNPYYPDDDTADEYPPAGRPDAPRPKTFEDLTLAQAIPLLLLRPVQTAQQVWRVLVSDPDDGAAMRGESPEIERWPDDDDDQSDQALPSWLDEDEIGGAGASEPETGEMTPDTPETSAAWTVLRDQIRLGLRIGALALATLLALRGGHVLHNAALDPVMKLQRDPGSAMFWLALAVVIYVGAELWFSRDWWAARFPRIAGEIRAQFQANPYWNAGVIVPLVVLLIMLVTGGSLLFMVIVAALAVCLWLMLLMGNSPPISMSDPDGRGGFINPPRAGHGPVPTGLEKGFRGETGWLETLAYSFLLIPPALVFSALAYSLNVQRAPGTDKVTDVIITTSGLLAWVISITLWIAALNLDVRRAWAGIQALAWGQVHLRRARIGGGTVLIMAAVIAVTALGAYFRLYDLASTPPEMTSDHIEKLRDALRVSEGYHGVFFPNNGGREGFQMFLVALIAERPGVGFSFDALKLATVLEGVITLPALWWMARQIIGTDTDERRQLGNWIGIALAGLVAISAWHVMLSRLGLRIALTPFTSALVIGFLARAMRHNRTRDYLALGFMLGVGIYFYQANRMLPLVALFGIGIALLARAKSWREVAQLAAEGIGFAAVALTPLAAARVLVENSGESERLAAFMPLLAMFWFALVTLIARSRRGDPVLQYGGGLLAAAVIALAVYIPMYHYAEINPDQFWNRTRGRMFGEQAFVRLNPQTGSLEAYEPTLREQAERFWDQRDVFEDNYADALRMFHWEGDGAWISNPHSYPALDGVAGGLLILGLAAWGAWLFRQRDPALWLLPISVLIMLLPSAMTVAFSNENPNFTRASGAIPGVFMLAAFPVGMLCGELTRVNVRSFRAPAGGIAALALIAGLLWYGIGWNWQAFFTDYRLNYSYSWKPYHEISKPMRDFAQGEGSYGNAFMVAYPHWLDHRILGTMAGDIRWPNGLVTREDLLPAIRRNQGTPYQYDSTKPLWVMYHIDDPDTAAYLDTLLPGGTHTLYEYRYETLEPGYYSQGSFYIFTVRAGETPLE
jgi:hypothetical protein